MKSVYLAGNISSDFRTYEWRDIVASALADRMNVVNPAANRFNQDLINNFSGEHDKFIGAAIIQSQGLLPPKDYQMISGCDLIIVNLKIITPEKPLIGTLFELAWAWEMHLPVIAIKGTGIYSTHPFIASAVSAWVRDEYEACDVALRLFL